MRLLKACEFFMEKSSACNKNCAPSEQNFETAIHRFSFSMQTHLETHRSHHRFLQRALYRKNYLA